MNLDTFLAYRSATDPKQSQRLLNDLVKGEEKLLQSCAHRLGRCDTERADLLQAGRIGLLGALKKFDPTKGAWASYARQWVLQEMDRDVIQRRPFIRGARHWTKKMPQNLRRAKDVFLACNGIEATAGDLGISEDAYEDYRPLETDLVPVEQLLGVPAEILDDTLSASFVRAIGRLSQEESRVFLRHIFQGETLGEVAQAEGLLAQEVKVLFERSKTKLRRHLLSEKCAT